MLNNISPRQTIVAIASLSIVIIIGAIVIVVNNVKTNERLSYLEGKVGK